MAWCYVKTIYGATYRAKRFEIKENAAVLKNPLRWILDSETWDIIETARKIRKTVVIPRSEIERITVFGGGNGKE